MNVMNEGLKVVPKVGGVWRHTCGSYHQVTEIDDVWLVYRRIWSDGSLGAPISYSVEDLEAWYRYMSFVGTEEVLPFVKRRIAGEARKETFVGKEVKEEKVMKSEELEVGSVWKIRNVDSDLTYRVEEIFISKVGIGMVLITCLLDGDTYVYSALDWLTTMERIEDFAEQACGGAYTPKTLDEEIESLEKSIASQKERLEVLKEEKLRKSFVVPKHRRFCFMREGEEAHVGCIERKYLSPYRDYSEEEFVESYVKAGYLFIWLDKEWREG